MSKLNTILRSSAFVGTGAAALFLTACAGNSSANRYGNVYDYESGGSCLPPACAAPAPAPVPSVRYGAPEQVVYADCSVVQNMGCAPAPAPVQTYPVYQAPAPVAAPAPVQTYPVYDAAPAISYGGETAPCPAGTVSNGDGTGRHNACR